MLYSLDDYVIVPSVTSRINSRLECNPYIYDKVYPIFTAPMSSVINENNYKIFQKAGIRTIIPRNVDIEVRLKLMCETFVAMSLSEFETYFCDKNSKLNSVVTVYHICIDIANGHMQRLFDLGYKAKSIYGDNLQLMAGNIANPQTYIEYAKAGFDYIRVGIGNSHVCTTSANSGIHYGLASLLQECYDWKTYVKDSFNKMDKCMFRSIPKIIADGGFQNFDQINKALAFGADYVMLGEIFAKTLEACGEIKYKRLGDFMIYRDGPFQEYVRNQPIDKVKDMECYREYYGMSTKRAQTEISGNSSKTAEGISKIVPIEYTLEGWLDNFSHYLRSAMSYCNSKTLNEFKENARLEIVSPLVRMAYFK